MTDFCAMGDAMRVTTHDELETAEQLVAMVHECTCGCAVSRVRVRIGRRRFLVPDTLKFCFELATAGTDLEGATLEVEVRPGRELSVRSVQTVEAS